jgi:hypothetical protein
LASTRVHPYRGLTVAFWLEDPPVIHRRHKLGEWVYEADLLGVILLLHEASWFGEGQRNRLHGPHTSHVFLVLEGEFGWKVQEH